MTMKVNYGMMLRHAEHDLEQAEDELREFRMNTGLSVAGKVRKETLRNMISYRNALFQRVENLKKEMRADE
ncbi:hypothetical protein [Leuconostoc lactis]|uniref:hypothetical protein n=1 Tax=Leuconostoc lactis TaxID=1246 RepID=UPI00031EDF58|nr:hypothetical protein [Leuconostoc lactis]